MKIIIVTILTLFAQLASASFVESCLFSAEVVKVSSILNPAVGGVGQVHIPQYHVDVVAQVLAATANSGSYTNCQHYVGQEVRGKMTSVSLKSLVSLKKGLKIEIDAFRANSFSPTGSVQTSRLALVDGAHKAYQATLNDSKVYEAIDIMRSNLGHSQAPAGLLHVVGHKVPETLCGFAGCSDTYYMTLTYGQAFHNSVRDSILVKVVIDTFGQPISVQLAEVKN